MGGLFLLPKGYPPGQNYRVICFFCVFLNNPHPNMKNSYFTFKQFSLNDQGATMKIGTDGVLLGAWCSLKNPSRILDIGTGSGLIALMLAQRTASHVTIHGLDIEKENVYVATKNVNASPWKSRIKIIHSSLQQFLPPQPYDLVVSNPPFFSKSLLPEKTSRLVSRHTEFLSHEALAQHTLRLLSPTGTFQVILPSAEGQAFINICRKEGFYCIRKCAFSTRKEKPVSRFLLAFSRLLEPLDENNLYLYEKENVWSEDYFSLTKAFYTRIHP